MQTEPVVTRYSADAGQLLASLEQIKASQTRLSSAVDKQSAALAAQNKKLSESIAFWGKLNAGIAIIPGVVGKFQSAFSEAADLLQMKAAAGKVSIEALDDALHGQLRTTERYSLAAAINSSKLKLNETQQRQLAGAIRQLGLEGNNTTEVARDFARVLASGETNELKKYGIAVTDINGKAKDFASVMRDDLIPMAEKAGNVATTEAERMRNAANAIGEAFDSAKMKVAEWGVATVKALGDAGKAAGRELGSGGPLDYLLALAGVNMTNMNAIRDAANKVLDEGTASALAAADFARVQAKNARLGATTTVLDGLEISLDRGRSSGGRGGESSEARARRLAALIASVDAGKLENFAAIAVGSRFAGTTGSGTLQRDVGAFDAGMSAEHLAGIQAVLDASVATNAAIAAAGPNERATFLEQNFGSIESINGYAVAFDALGAAGTAAMSAWIDGSMSAGAAIKAALAESIKALAIDMTMKALQHGAYAIGSLAFGDARGAALHAKSAAMFAAGAVLAGGAARGLGSGGSSAGGAAQTVPPGGSSESRDTASTIVYGDSFADDSPRMRARQARRLIRRAREFN